MASGQIANVIVCSSSTPLGSYFQLDPAAFTFCPAGQAPFSLVAYVPFETAKGAIDGVDAPLDPVELTGFLGFGFFLVVFAYMVGLKGSVLLKPFWGKH